MHELPSFQFRVKSPFPPGSFDLLAATRQIAESVQSSFTVLVECPVSAIIPKQLRDNAAKTSKSAWWYGSAPLVICDGYSPTHARMAILCPSMRGYRHVRDLLEECQFPYVLASSPAELRQSAANIKNILQRTTQWSESLHYCQDHFAKPLREYYGNDNSDAEFSSLLEEVALSAVIALPDWTSREYRTNWVRKLPKGLTNDGAIELEWMVDHGNKTSFDFVCTLESPQLFPFMAIEFDGPHHNTAEAIVKDSLKDLICQEAGLPLLRVGVEFMGPQSGTAINLDYCVRAFRRNFAEFSCTYAWYTASAWKDTLQTADIVSSTPIEPSVVRLKTLHKKYPSISDVHRNLKSYFSLEEKYREDVNGVPAISIENDDVKGTRASLKVDKSTLQSPWLRIRGGVPRPFLDWDELEEVYCRRYVTEQALQKLNR